MLRLFLMPGILTRTQKIHTISIHSLREMWYDDPHDLLHHPQFNISAQWQQLAISGSCIGRLDIASPHVS